MLPSNGREAVWKTLPVIFSVKLGQIVRRGTCGSVSAEEKMDSVRAFGAGMCVFGKMDGSRCPRRDAAQCCSIAASGLVAGGAWHGHPAPAAPARPHPGPGLPFTGAGSCFYVCLAAVCRRAVGRSRSPRCERGQPALWGRPLLPLLPRLLVVGTKARPAARMQAKTAGLRMGGGSLMLGKRQLGRGCRRMAQQCAEAVVHSVWSRSSSVHLPETITTTQLGIDSIHHL